MVVVKGILTITSFNKQFLDHLFVSTIFGSYRMFVYFYFTESQNQLHWKSPEIIESNLLVCFSIFVQGARWEVASAKFRK